MDRRQYGKEFTWEWILHNKSLIIILGDQLSLRGMFRNIQSQIFLRRSCSGTRTGVKCLKPGFSYFHEKSQIIFFPTIPVFANIINDNTKSQTSPIIWDGQWPTGTTGRVSIFLDLSQIFYNSQRSFLVFDNWRCLLFLMLMIVRSSVTGWFHGLDIWASCC